MDVELKVEEKAKKKKNNVSVKGVLAKILIVVLALLMVGSAYYIVILLTESKNEEKSSYGSYDGEPILIEYNNVFYNTLMADESFQQAYLSGDYTTLWSSYYNGYQAQVLYIAMSKMAAEAGITAPQALVNKAILDSGVYNDEDGKFSVDIYNSTDAQTRSNSEGYMRSILPYQTAFEDFTTIITTAQEKQYVADLAKDARNLQYFVVNYKAYPDDKAVEFGKANADLFKAADVTAVSFSTSDAAQAGYELLVAGTAAEEVEGASVSSVNASVNTIQGNLDNSADIDKILALEVGQYSEPLLGKTAYTIYKLDSAFAAADFEDEAVIEEVKQYLYSTNKDEVNTYIESAKSSADALASSDFEKAAELVGSSIINVDGVANNIADSEFITGADYLDSEGTLASAVADSSVSREVFTASVGSIVGPVTVDGGYLFVKVAGLDKESMMGSLIDTIYDYYAFQLPVNDMSTAILSSSKLTDNFTAQFLTQLLGSQTN